ncbi:MAG: folB [Microbacteriaceae bacterium]|nr:folB [Microbacteriaceae bacterium]
MNFADEITLTGLRAFAYHGALPEERETGQEFVIDVRVMLDLSAASSSDDLEKTVHYGVLAEQVVAAVESNPVDLIETVAQRIADIVLEYPQVTLTWVTVHKPNAPITVPFADVSVTIARGRS